MKPIYNEKQDICEIPYSLKGLEQTTKLYCPGCGEDTLAIGQNGWAECCGDCGLYIQINRDNQAKINEILRWAKIGEEQCKKSQKS